MSLGSVKIYVGVTDLDWFEYLSAAGAAQSLGSARCRSLMQYTSARTALAASMKLATACSFAPISTKSSIAAT